EGRNLRETLLLNLVLGDPSTGARRSLEGEDVPIWERAKVLGPAARADRDNEPWQATGQLDMLTWQSRRVRLAVETGRVVGVVLANDDALNPQNRYDVEHMTAWRRSETQEKKLGAPRVYMPRKHDPERALWRGLAGLLPQTVRD